MKNKNGITLIALVITIVVLIILAGVAINLTLGENGILNKAQQAKQKQSEQEAREKLELVLSNARIEKETNTSYNDEYLNSMLEAKGIAVDGDYVIVDNYNYLIDREQLIIKDSLGETQIKVTTKVEEYLGKNANNKYEANLLLTVESNAGLQTVVVTKPDATTTEVRIEEAKTGKSMTVELDVEYIVTVTTKDGKATTRKIVEKSEETISSVAELVAFRDAVNSGLTYEGKTISLTQDIDLASVCGEDIDGNPVSWEPIGTETNPFKGTFDGNKKMITSLYINSSDNIQGLFGNNNGIIQELILENGTIYASTSDYIGTIVGLNRGIIRNCNNKANIIGQSLFCCGGITGWSGGKIQQCVNKGNIQNTNRKNTGGIVGDSRGLIENCFNLGTVQGGQYVGGIVGAFYFYEQGNESTIKNCYNVGNIIASTAAGSIAATNGNDATWTGGTIQNCYYLEGTSNKGIYSSYNAIKNEASSKTLEQMKNLAPTLGDAYVADGKIKNSAGEWVDNIDESGNIIYINNGYPILKWQVEE